MGRLSLPCESNAHAVGHNEPHGTSVWDLLSQASKRAIGRAYDRGIVKEVKKK